MMDKEKCKEYLRIVFAMVASLYEYFDTGRCVALEGANGAYNILETEIRLDRIISKLDVVIRRLDRIIDNQYALYEKISESNRLLSDIEENIRQTAYLMKTQNFQTADLQLQIRKLQQQSKIGNYRAEQTRREVEYMNCMDSFR